MAEEVGKVIDLDAIIARRPRNRVLRVGIELEGGFIARPGLPKVIRDGSVFKSADAGGLERQGYPGILFGEIPLDPIQPIQIARALRTYYPNYIDDSCGLHMHMSFETVLHYAMLADSPDYQETMVEYLRRWAKDNKLEKKHPIWDRLDGKSEYCQKKFWPEAQIQQNIKDHDHDRWGHRYTMVHYGWGRYKTVECRILPMMATVDLATSALKEVIKVTNAYLLSSERVRAKAGGTVPKIGTNTEIKLEWRKGEIYEEFHED